MFLIIKYITLTLAILPYISICQSAKINTPRVLLPWFEDLNINFTFDIVEGGCYTWSLSRDDIISIEPLYEDAGGYCSKSARVTVSKVCPPPGSVIILAEEVNTGEILRGDVSIDKISSLEVMSTTWKLYLEEAPEAFEVIAYDDEGNRFSTLEGVPFTWTIDNENNEPIVTLVRWQDTDYEAPRSVLELESKGLRANMVLLYGQALGETTVTVCLDSICTNFKLNVVASVVLTPAIAMIAPGDTLRYKVVRARAGRLTVQDVVETLYNIQIHDTDTAVLEDTISLVRAKDIGSTTVHLMSGQTEVATATLHIVEPHSIKVTLRPTSLLIRDETFIIHSIVLDKNNHALLAGDETLIRLTVEGDANVELLKSTENGTITYAVGQKAGPFVITARLHSIAGRTLSKKVEGQISATVVDPLQVIPAELNVAWTNSIQEIQLKYSGGGDNPVEWSTSERKQDSLSLTPDGVLTVRGVGDMKVHVSLKNYPHVKASGRVSSAIPELLQVASTGHARVGKPHYLHVALTGVNTETGEYYNFQMCNCAVFAVSLLEGPEPQNVTAAPWITPAEGACCVMECAWSSRGVSLFRVSHGPLGHNTRVTIRAAPMYLWPSHAHAIAALHSATLPVLVEGEALTPASSDTRVAELSKREGQPPYNYPDVQLFTLKCKRKGYTTLELISYIDEERESAELEMNCAPSVARVRLEPSEAAKECSQHAKLWLRPGQEVSVRVTLFDSIGRELLDERGPKMTWETEPRNKGIEFKTTNRLFVEFHPDYAPVPVPYKYYQLITVSEAALGWNGTIKASIPDGTSSLQARVVSPLSINPLVVNIAWDGEVASNITLVSGGSGHYTVESPKGVTATVENGSVNAVVPAPGIYDLIVADLCVQQERQLIEVNIEEVVSIQVYTSRAICVGNCAPLSAVVMGLSGIRLKTSKPIGWRVSGNLAVKGDMLCGTSEGSGRIRASYAGVWSSDVEVSVFPPLQIIPSVARVPPSTRVQLRYVGGPPHHLASHHYQAVAGVSHVEVSSTGSVHGISVGKARIKLIASDINNSEMASAESDVEVIPISGIKIGAATQTLLVGSPGPVWVEAGGLSPGALSALHPPPRVLWTVRDTASARLYSTHVDDMLERSSMEGLSVRVVPLKPGIITVDVHVKNIGQVADTRYWDSTIEILGIMDIKTTIEGRNQDLKSGDRLALALGATVRLKSFPRSEWTSYGDGVFEVSPSGEVKALNPGHGVIVGRNKDERNNIYRETVIHVEVGVPHYCTAEPTSDENEFSTRLVMRNAYGRELLAPQANISSDPPMLVTRSNSVMGPSFLMTGLDTNGAFMSFKATASGVTVTDDVLVLGSDQYADGIIATGGWSICLEGVGWRAPPDVTLYPGSGVTLAMLSRDTHAKHLLRLDRPPTTLTLHQLSVDKIEFLSGEWPSTMVPLNIEASGAKSGPLLCSEEQKYALEGVDVTPPFSCRTKTPYTARAILDITNGQLGCSITPPKPVTESSEIELCAEWGASQTCTKVLILPLIRVSTNKISLLKPPADFVISGHPHALKHLKMSTSPGLKIETSHKEGELQIVVKSDSSTCGLGWVNVVSVLTAQEIRVEVERDCDVTCGTLLGAIFSLLKDNLSTIITVVAVAGAYTVVQSKLQQKSQNRPQVEPPQTVLPPQDATTPLTRTRTWSRSPYASNGPAAPIYGDTSVLPDNSFSPNSSRMHSRFL